MQKVHDGEVVVGMDDLNLLHVRRRHRGYVRTQQEQKVLLNRAEFLNRYLPTSFKMAKCYGLAIRIRSSRYVRINSKLIGPY